MVVFRLIKEYLNVRALAIVILAGKVNSKFCNGGHICSPPKECCPLGCCLVFASPGYRPTKSQIPESSSSMSNFLLWNHWLLWILLVLLLFILLCGCGLWKKRQLFSSRLYRRTSRHEEERSEFDSTGSCYPPPQYSRCSSFHYAPPPYTEVTSKPDLYPLVISYRSDNGKFGDNCVMVQYFRNYVVHPALSSTGNAIDSINSGFFSQPAQEVDSNYPPSYEESRVGEMNLPELESSDGLPHRGQSGQYLPNAEMAQIIVESIHQSVQKGSATANESSNVKGNSLATFKGEKVLQNSAKSLPGNLFPNATKGLKEGERPRHIYLSTFKQVNKSVLLSNSADSLSGNSGVPAHQYSSDVILAQPQSYCESNHDLHYDSSDILNNPNHFLLRVNDSYSSEDNLSQPRGSLQDFVSSDGLSHSQFSNLETNNFSTSSEVSSLQGCGSPDSPPQAISPTGEFRNLLEKIQQLPNQKDGSKYLETKLYDLSSDEYRSREIRLSISKKPKERENFSRIDESERGDDSEETEKCTLLTELPQSASKPKSRKLSVIRPNKLLNRENFLSRSKTFYMPFCNGSFNSKKSSTSAPVTPISNFPSPGTLSLNFLSNPNKFGSKKSLESKADGRLLLQDGEHESNDELF